MCDIGGFHVTSSPPCWWTETRDLSLAFFVRPTEVVHFSIVIGVSRSWLKRSIQPISRIFCHYITSARTRKTHTQNCGSLISTRSVGLRGFQSNTW